MALTSNRDLGRHLDQEVRAYPVAAAVRIYRCALVGRDPGGYLKPFVPGDDFVGVAYEESDNTSGAAAAKTCRVYVQGDFDHALSGVTVADIGKAVFATDDDALSLLGHFDGFVGRVIAVPSSNVATIRIRPVGLRPLASDGGCIEVCDDFTGLIQPVLTAGNELHIRGLRMDAIGAGIVSGSGITSVLGTSGVLSLLLDNDNEAENLTIETGAFFSVTRGIKFEARLHLAVAGGAATDDVDFGLMTAASSTITDAIRANMDATTSGIKTAKFHLDANANDVFCGSDDDTTVVGPVDSTFDNVTTAGTFADYVIIARTSGVCEFWINGVRRLSSTAFSVSNSGVFAGIINIEKSTGTGVPELRLDRLRVTGGRA